MRGAAAALALVIAVAASTAGLRYVWCAPMGEVRASCCCPTPRGHDAIRAHCCDQRTVPEMTRVELSDAPVRALPAPMVAVLPLWALFAAWDAVESPERRGVVAAARAGPRARVHAAHSVYLI